MDTLFDIPAPELDGDSVRDLVHVEQAVAYLATSPTRSTARTAVGVFVWRPDGCVLELRYAALGAAEIVPGLATMNGWHCARLPYPGMAWCMCEMEAVGNVAERVEQGAEQLVLLAA